MWSMEKKRSKNADNCLFYLIHSSPSQRDFPPSNKKQFEDKMHKLHLASKQLRHELKKHSPLSLSFCFKLKIWQTRHLWKDVPVRRERGLSDFESRAGKESVFWHGRRLPSTQVITSSLQWLTDLLFHVTAKVTKKWVFSRQILQR